MTEKRDPVAHELKKLAALLGERLPVSPLALVPVPFDLPAPPFHRWFAWHWLWTYDGRFTWFRHVYRRRIVVPDMPERWEFWQYARDDGYAP